MIRDEKLHLPDDWESVLEQLVFKTPANDRNGRTYICSPCRAGTPDGMLRNIKAARVYMFYAYQHMPGIPAAPHAYLPFLLNDNVEWERTRALELGSKLLMRSNRMLVCGSRLSDGMLGEIACAVDQRIPIHVFNKKVYRELCGCMEFFGIYPGYPQYEDLHFALSWGSDELAPYWEAA